MAAEAFPLSSDRTAHLCVDMQRLFEHDGPWPTPWMLRVLPRILALVQAHAARTVFTCFIPPWRAEDAPGHWADFYRHNRHATRECLDDGRIDLVPALQAFVPPARVVDKPAYSPFFGSALHELLQVWGVDTLVVTGAETDVCVLAAVLSAVDHGYRVVVARDALCSANDDTHDALLKLYGQRFSSQVELASIAEILQRWPSLLAE